MAIYIKTKKHIFFWNYKKMIKNIAIVGAITTFVSLYLHWFIQYQAYLQSLMN